MTSHTIGDNERVPDERTCWRVNTQRDRLPATKLPMWRECFSALEAALLHIAPIYYGFGFPTGDRSGVVLIPGFLGTDAYLFELYAWLHRMDYRPYFSGIGLNAECPNLLIRRALNDTVDRARQETGGKVHLIGHSLGGIMAMAMAAQRPHDIASVITLAAPFRGPVAHPNILRLADYVRNSIQARNAEVVLPNCYTGHCTCDFVDSLEREMPLSVMMSAIYSRTDAIVDWRYCVTGDPELDFEVPGTHVGLVVNPSAYAVLANRLAQAQAHSPVA
jgi:pimeloyl-ACP methyl ester carboxylesterase